MLDREGGQLSGYEDDTMKTPFLIVPRIRAFSRNAHDRGYFCLEFGPGPTYGNHIFLRVSDKRNADEWEDELCKLTGQEPPPRRRLLTDGHCKRKAQRSNYPLSNPPAVGGFNTESSKEAVEQHTGDVVGYENVSPTPSPPSLQNSDGSSESSSPSSSDVSPTHSLIEDDVTISYSFSSGGSLSPLSSLRSTESANMVPGCHDTDDSSGGLITVLRGDLGKVHELHLLPADPEAVAQALDEEDVTIPEMLLEEELPQAPVEEDVGDSDRPQDEVAAQALDEKYVANQERPQVDAGVQALVEEDVADSERLQVDAGVQALVEAGLADPDSVVNRNTQMNRGILKRKANQQHEELLENEDEGVEDVGEGEERCRIGSSIKIIDPPSLNDSDPQSPDDTSDGCYTRPYFQVNSDSVSTSLNSDISESSSLQTDNNQTDETALSKLIDANLTLLADLFTKDDLQRFCLEANFEQRHDDRMLLVEMRKNLRDDAFKHILKKAVLHRLVSELEHQSDGPQLKPSTSKEKKLPEEPSKDTFIFRTFGDGISRLVTMSNFTLFSFFICVILLGAVLDILWIGFFKMLTSVCIVVAGFLYIAYLHGKAATSMKASKRKFGYHGGDITIGQYDFTLSIPPGALDKGSTHEIGIEVLTEQPDNFVLEADDALVSFGFKCTPSGLTFRKPVTVTFPHCAVLEDTGGISLVMYSWSNDLQQWVRITELDQQIHINENTIDVHLTHFCKWWVAANGVTLKRIRFQPFLHVDLPCDRQTILRVHLGSNVKGSLENIEKLEKEMNYKPVHPKDSICVRLAQDARSLTLSCKIEGSKSASTKEVYPLIFKQLERVETLRLDLKQCADDSMAVLTLEQCEKRDIDIRTGYSSKTTTVRRRLNTEITDTDLLKLSKEIPNNKVGALGTLLQIPAEDISRYKNTNADFRHNSEGTLLMLQEWKLSRKSTEQIPELVTGLKEKSVGLGSLAEKYFLDHIQQEGSVSGNTSQHPSTSSIATSNRTSRVTQNVNWFTRLSSAWAAFGMAIVTVIVAVIDFCVVGSGLWSCLVHMKDLGTICVLLISGYTFLSQNTPGQ